MSALVDSDHEDEDMPQLSLATLNALKDFALGAGVSGVMESEEDLDVVTSVRNHFKVKDREETFDQAYTSTKDPSRTVDFKVRGVKRELGMTLDSTGLTIWRAAEHLCQYIIDCPERFENKTICELGAGLGLVSILLAKCVKYKELVATDGCEDTVRLLIENKIDNECDFDTSYLWWGDCEDFMSIHPGGFDTVLAADVIYEPEQVEPLLATAKLLLKDSGELVLAYARRNVPVDGVLKMAEEQFGLEWEMLEDTGAPFQEPIFILRNKKSS